jgi:hypothetical protein
MLALSSVQPDVHAQPRARDLERNGERNFTYTWRQLDLILVRLHEFVLEVVTQNHHGRDCREKLTRASLLLLRQPGPVSATGV